MGYGSVKGFAVLESVWRARLLCRPPEHEEPCALAALVRPPPASCSAPAPTQALSWGTNHLDSYRSHATTVMHCTSASTDYPAPRTKDGVASMDTGMAPHPKRIPQKRHAGKPALCMTLASCCGGWRYLDGKVTIAQ